MISAAAPQSPMMKPTIAGIVGDVQRRDRQTERQRRLIDADVIDAVGHQGGDARRPARSPSAARAARQRATLRRDPPPAPVDPATGGGSILAIGDRIGGQRDARAKQFRQAFAIRRSARLRRGAAGRRRRRCPWRRSRSGKRALYAIAAPRGDRAAGKIWVGVGGVLIPLCRTPRNGRRNGRDERGEARQENNRAFATAEPSGRVVAAAFIAFVAVCSADFVISEEATAIHNDMAEAYAWGREFQLGYNQHPPFWAWIADVVPDFSSRRLGFRCVLSMLNAGIGLACASRLIARFAGGRRAGGDGAAGC